MANKAFQSRISRVLRRGQTRMGANAFPWCATRRFASALMGTCETPDRQPSFTVVDAESVFYTLVKQTAASKQDRRIGIDLVLKREDQNQDPLGPSRQNATRYSDKN